MGLIAMSERDLQRIEVLSKVIAGRMTMMSAAHVLDLSERQVRRLLERIRTGGAASIRHKAIGRPSNNRISDGVRDYAVTLVRECYADFGPTLAAEKLAERDGLLVSRETLRSWMSDAGLWLSRKPRDGLIPFECRISQRPDFVDDRSEFGHWEGDLLIFKRELGEANITSLVERKSR